jgi:hypothetical protein
MAAPAARSLDFAVRGPIACDDLPGLCARVRALFADGPCVAYCDVRSVPPTP